MRIAIKALPVFLPLLLMLTLSLTSKRKGHAFGPVKSNPLNVKSWQAKSPTIFAAATSTSESQENSETKAIAPKLDSFNVKDYYLLWSPGVWKKLITGTTTLLVAHILGGAFLFTNPMEANTFPFVHASYWQTIKLLAKNVILPLLSSACCMVQLALNILSFGCAGFNSILGPIRPYFVSMLVYLTYIEGVSSRTNSIHWISKTVLRWSVALLPEAIDVWNGFQSSSLPTSTRVDISSSRQLVGTVRINIPTMGCVGCVKSVDNALRQVPGVAVAASALTGGGVAGGHSHVQIAADSETEVAAIVELLKTAVSDAGFFGGSVESVQIQNQQALTNPP